MTIADGRSGPIFGVSSTGEAGTAVLAVATVVLQVGTLWQCSIGDLHPRIGVLRLAL